MGDTYTYSGTVHQSNEWLAVFYNTVYPKFIRTVSIQPCFSSEYNSEHSRASTYSASADISEGEKSLPAEKYKPVPKGTLEINQAKQPVITVRITFSSASAESKAAHKARYI